MSSSFRTRQPGKALYTTGFFVVTPVRILFYLVYYLPRFLRQHPRWTYRQAVGKAMFQLFWEYTSAVHFQPSKSLQPGAEKERFVTVEPASTDKYLDLLDVEPRPTTIGGVWYPTKYSPDTDAGKKIALHFHGGAYVLGGCRPMEGGLGPEMLAKKISGLTFCPQYRLASHPHSRFPAAIQDSVTAYAYLLSLGIPASDILLSGDSAGGNLVLALVRYLMEQKDLMPFPQGVLLWSPWVDIAAGPQAMSQHRNYHIDYLPARLAEWALSAYVPPGISPRHPYITPLGHEFVIPAPVFLQTGTSEVLHDEHVKFAKAMEKIPGNRVELLEIANAPHDIFAAGMIVGFLQEADSAMEAAWEFLNDTKKA